MAFKTSRIRFKKNGRKFITHTTRFGRKSPYNTKSWRYNGKKVYL